MKTLFICVILLIIPILVFADKIQALNLGKTKAVACASCHGNDGNSQIATYPKIAQQNERYFIEQMLDFKKGKQSGRENTIMQAIAQSLSPQDIVNLAAYFNTQKMSIDGAKAQYLSLGQRIYKGGIINKGIPACSACHGPQGEGNAEAGFPHLGGQHADYILAQLNAYHNGQRKNDINHIMGTIASKMDIQEMTAVASYVAGLH